MKKFFRDHPDVLLVILAAMFSVFIIAYFVWGIGDVIAAVNIALKVPPPQQGPQFQLEDASQLNLHGLGQ
jgi:hypothetical protein